MQRLPFFQWLQALSILLCFMLPCTLHAGAVPDAGTIERTLPKPPKTLPLEFEKPLTDEKEVIDVGPKILIKDFDFIGNKVITTEALSMLVAPYKNKNLSMTDLENIRLLIGDYYRQQGFWASVIYGDQDFADNILVVDIFEAKVGSILHESDDEPRFPRERIIAFIERNQDKGQSIKIKDLDYSIQDLNSVAGIFSS
ncbi:MAG: POTRA domain-containing protein, partial [Alphaproteobacteria bacterium]